MCYKIWRTIKSHSNRKGKKKSNMGGLVHAKLRGGPLKQVVTISKNINSDRNNFFIIKGVSTIIYIGISILNNNNSDKNVLKFKRIFYF